MTSLINYLPLVNVMSLFIFFVVNFNFVFSLCSHGYFILPGQNQCHKWLDCNDISGIKVESSIGYGTIKNVYLARWGNLSVAYSELRSQEFVEDFQYGLEMLISLNPNPHIIQLIGFCKEKNIIITEYHRFNNAVQVKHLLRLYHKDSIANRVKLCLQYAQILEFLHNSPIGVRVNCDSNDLKKLLSQLLITNDFEIVLNDLDALPEVTKNRSIKCGPRPIYSYFVPPEQRWDWKDRDSYSFNGYNEKTDIWKAANVCNYFIQGPDSEIVQYLIFETHKKCKSKNPNERPSASALVHKYAEVLEDIPSHSEL